MIAHKVFNAASGTWGTVEGAYSAEISATLDAATSGVVAVVVQGRSVVVSVAAMYERDSKTGAMRLVMKR